MTLEEQILEIERDLRDMIADEAYHLSKMQAMQRSREECEQQLAERKAKRQPAEPEDTYGHRVAACSWNGLPISEAVIARLIDEARADMRSMAVQACIHEEDAAIILNMK